MLYINFVYKGTVVNTVGFFINDSEESRKAIEKEILEGEYNPQNWERYLFSDYNMINEWVG